MELHHVLYQSKAAIDTDDPEHNAILASCRKNNGAAGLTGFLHREADFFLQYLEGPPDALDEAMARIGTDPRHTDIIVIDRGPIRKRYLPDWQMGFVDPDRLSLADLIETTDDGLNLTAQDPFDLVVFMVSNADALRETKDLAA